MTPRRRLLLREGDFRTPGDGPHRYCRMNNPLLVNRVQTASDLAAFLPRESSRKALVGPVDRGGCRVIAQPPSGPKSGAAVSSDTSYAEGSRRLFLIDLQRISQLEFSCWISLSACVTEQREGNQWEDPK